MTDGGTQHARWLATQLAEHKAAAASATETGVRQAGSNFKRAAPATPVANTPSKRATSMAKPAKSQNQYQNKRAWS